MVNSAIDFLNYKIHHTIKDYKNKGEVEFTIPWFIPFVGWIDITYKYKV